MICLLYTSCYYYEPNAITVEVTSKSEPEDTEHITWLFLPMVQEEIDRALLRGGITDPSETVSYTHLDVYKRQLPARDIPAGCHVFYDILCSFCSPHPLVGIGTGRGSSGRHRET